MKRIAIDENLCQGSRVCAGIAPTAVDFDDDGIARVTGAVLTDEVATLMESACPSMAITVVDVPTDATA
ncbi:MAG: ferredoxin [Mycobacterium sp.]